MIKRPEYFVSLCFGAERDLESELTDLKAVASECERRLSHWEIIYVVHEDRRDALRARANELATLRNLRILLVRSSINSYRRRVIGAAEAIGDVLVVASLIETRSLDVIAFAEHAMREGRIVIAQSPRRPLFSFHYGLLGLISRYRIDPCNMKTLASPRASLSAILLRPTASIELRFQPKHGVLPYVRKVIPKPPQKAGGALGERLELMSEIITTSASRFLTGFAALGGTVAFLALAYIVYVVVVFLTQENVQQGWFSTGVVLGGSTTFLSLGMAVIALGIAHIVDRLGSGSSSEVLEEMGNVSFYDRVDELNVEVDTVPSKADAA